MSPESVVRIEAAVAGLVDLSALSPAEARAANLGIDARIRERAGATGFGDLLLADGIPVVALEADGHEVVEFLPDGGSRQHGGMD